MWISEAWGTRKYVCLRGKRKQHLKKISKPSKDINSVLQKAL
jgi:hypothetical protein